MLATGADIRVLRDPTRGGLATTLNEIARQSGAMPAGQIVQWVRDAVRA